MTIEQRMECLERTNRTWRSGDNGAESNFLSVTVRLAREAERWAGELGVDRIHLSLINTKELSVAVVIMEGGS